MKTCKDIAAGIFAVLLIAGLIFSNSVLQGLAFVAAAGMLVLIAIELSKRDLQIESDMDKEQLIRELKADNRRVKYLVVAFAVGFVLYGLYLMIALH